METKTLETAEEATARNSGYHDCPCRDCFEIAIGTEDDGTPSLCHACETAGCDASGGSGCECEPESDPHAAGDGFSEHDGATDWVAACSACNAK